MLVFEQHGGEAVPEDLDAYAKSVGLETRQGLYRVIEREYLYSQMQQGDVDDKAVE